MGARLGALVLVFSLACLAARASAQDTPPPDTSPQVVEARQHIANGEAFFNANNFDGALVEFQRAYDLLEGKPIRYIVLFNIGQCHERMFRYDQALEYYQRYLDEGGPQAEDRATVEATMRALQGLLGVITITANVPTARVFVDQREVGTLDGDHHDFRVPAGIHNIELRTTGYVPAQQQVSVAARNSATATFTLEHVSNYHGLPTVWFWSATVTAGVMAATGFILGGYALAEHGRLQSLANDTSNPDHFSVTAADDARITTFANVADIFFGLAGAFGITAVVLAFMTDWSGHPDSSGEAAPSTASLRLTPAISPAFTGLSLSGDF